MKIKEQENKIKLISKINEIVDYNSPKAVILLDADGTLIPYDSAEIMAKYLKGVDTADLKPIFKKYDDYCFSAFYDLAEYYSRYNTQEDFIKASEEAAKEIEIRDEFIQFFKLENVEFIIVTAGFSLLWSNIIDKYKLTNVNLIAGNNLYDDFIIGQAEKGIVVDTLKEKNKRVVCFGDALVDKEMFLKSDFGYLVVDDLEKSIVSYIDNDCRFEYISFGNTMIKSMHNTTFDSIKHKLDTKDKSLINN